jgi:para-nitrobenzyl esterase
VAHDLAERQLWGDYFIVSPAHFLAARMSAGGAPVWLYRFSYVPAARRGQVAGTPHGGELPYVFDNVDGPSTYGESARDQAMARTASAYWVRFARTGDPNGRGAVPWAPYEPGDEPLLDFTDRGPLRRRDFESGKMAFLQHLRLQWFHDNDIPTQ